tara:strand:+ start:852 stop:1151 length:300 start_codon:yes stop_codon:yes gene_type:complete
MHKVNVINCKIKDDSDFDYIYDNAIHNTMAEYFKWAECCEEGVRFEKSYTDKEDYNFSLIVDAVFDSNKDMALFKLAFGDKPLNKLVIKDGMEAYFEQN